MQPLSSWPKQISSPPPPPLSGNRKAHLRRGMTRKIHPKSASLETPKPSLASFGGHLHTPTAAPPTTLTVWRKSLLFNCKGFTVFDEKGNLVFRVDNYSKSGNLGEIVLMDAAGKPLLTIRRKMRLGLGEHWGIFEGEAAANPRFSVRKQVGFFQSRALARVTQPPPPPGCGGGGGGRGFEVEGSYAKRCCAVYDEKRRAIVEIGKKEAAGGVALGLDVFRLVVQPSFDAAVAMAIVILLEEMVGSKRSSSLLW